MQAGIRGIVPHHSRTCVTHHLLHPIAHLRFVAMNGTQATRGLFILKLTMCQALIGIFHQLLTFVTEFLIALKVPAIQLDHSSDDLLLTDDSHCVRFRIIKAANTPGTHPHKVSNVTIITEPQPQSITAKGGKIRQSKTRKQDIIRLSFSR